MFLVAVLGVGQPGRCEMDLEAVHALQDVPIKVDQPGGPGKFQ